jgi:uncharacterized RDD family membrane protein YckC
MNQALSLLWQRLVAFALDYLVISAYLVVLVALSLLIGVTPAGTRFRALFANPNSAELTAFALLVVPVLLYFALFESSPARATWGKRVRGLQVVTMAGTTVGLPRAIARNALKLLPWELTHACLWRIPGWPLAAHDPPLWASVGLVLVWVIVVLYAVSLLVSRTGQTLYDRLTGVRVVRAAPALAQSRPSRRVASNP